jgi:hypothetical protein
MFEGISWTRIILFALAALVLLIIIYRRKRRKARG